MTFKKLPNTSNNNCFACSPKNPYGLHMELYTDDTVLKSHLKLSKHFAGWGDVAHGGILATVLDEIMGWSGIYLLKQFTLTKKMEIEFIRAVTIGEKIEVTGSVLNTDGRRNALIEGTIRNDQKEICAVSKADFTLLSPKLAVRMGLVSANQMQDFFEPLFQA